MELDRKALGEAIKKARLDMNLTQEKLAEMVSVTPTHLKQLEAGRRCPSIEIMYQLATILNISVDAIFFPERKDGQDLQQRIELYLHNCSSHELHVIYALIVALLEKEAD